jgi:hypothetical protein
MPAIRAMSSHRAMPESRVKESCVAHGVARRGQLGGNDVKLDRARCLLVRRRSGQVAASRFTDLSS